MRMGLTPKLFLAVLMVAAFIVLAMGVAARLTFNRGFLDYLDQQEAQRMDNAMPALAAAYREHGNWQFIRDNPEIWIALMRPSGLPAHPTSNDFLSHPPPLADLTGTVMRLTLLDSQGHYVFGNPNVDSQSVKHPILIDGKTVGCLVMLPFRRVVEGNDLNFQSGQQRGILIIGTAALLLAALLAVWVARALLGPVRRIAEATYELADGDYTVRVQARSRDELGELANNFNRMAHVLEKNERMRREFVADVSHELRTPLAVMHAEFEILEDGVRPIDINAIKSLKAEAMHLSKLVEDLYQLSLADVGSLAYRKANVDLIDILQSTVDTFRERLFQAGIALDLKLPASPVTICADSNRIHQLFVNLIENSIRYTNAEGKLAMQCNSFHNHVVIDIMDSEPGVDETTLLRLFDRFYRAESSRNRASGGAGLGLPICRSIVEAHGGSIEAKHSTLGGLWLTIRLPTENS